MNKIGFCFRALRSIKAGRFSTQAVEDGSVRVTFPTDRIPLLEELFETPVLRTGEMNAEGLAQVKGYVPPVLSSQIEASLCHEFDRSILETDWTRWEDPLTSYEQAARLIHHTLAIYSNQREGKMKPDEWAAVADANAEWIRSECDALLAEIQSGDYSRWTQLLDNVKLTPAQREAVQPAAEILGQNPWLHPRTKGEVLQEICRIVTSTIKSA